VRGLNTDRANDLINSRYEKAFRVAMDDDFNSPEAISVLFDLAKDLNKIKEQDPDEAAQAGQPAAEVGWSVGFVAGFRGRIFASGDTSVGRCLIDTLIAQRRQARLDQNWALADEIRDKLNAMKVVIEDGTDGSQWRIERD
jgi:cysteinyl-tRNA synthetase